MTMWPRRRKKLHLGGRPVRVIPDAERREIEGSGLFDAAWYLAHAPEAAASGFDVLDHYATVRWRVGRSPGPYFDAGWYLQRYNDVSAAEVEPLLHLIRHGKAEGRVAHPTEPGPSLFDDFQSPGFNCEFGIVQRHFGCEMLSLFRFATISLDGLLALLEAGSDPFARADALHLAVSDDGEYMVDLEPQGFRFHTYVRRVTLPADQVLSHETKRLCYLWRKFMDDLEEGGRIFV